MTDAPQYPRLGPLLAYSFDKAVGATLRSWIWIIIIAVATLGLALGQAPLQVIGLPMVVWHFVAAANAMRLSDPQYRMGGRTVGRLLLAGIAAGLAAVFGLIALIWPGLYLATKFSVGQAAVVLDDVPGEVGLGRSWELTTGRFSQTFAFCVVTVIAVFATILVSAVLLGGLVGALQAFHLIPSSREAIAFVQTITVPIEMYARQAWWIAGLQWYRSLKAMQAAQLEASTSPATSS